MPHISPRPKPRPCTESYSLNKPMSFGGVHDDHEREMYQRVQDQRHQADKVQAARGLSPAEEFRVPREAGDERRRHTEPGQDHQRGDEKDHPRIRELLQRIIRVKRAVRRDLKPGIRQNALPNSRDNRPACRNEPSPLASDTEQGHVAKAVQHPHRDNQKMPIP
jgi:hypothetical protein